MKIKEFTRKSLIAGVFVLNQRLQDKLLSRLRSQQLSYLGALVLVALYFERKDAAGPSRLAATLGFSRSRISQEVSKLERLGLLRREIASLDSRSFRLKLSPKGEKSAVQVIRTFEDVQRRIDCALSEKGAELLTSRLLAASEILS
jgi:DNA-binding MarR family transcriptional regulator